MPCLLDHWPHSAPAACCLVEALLLPAAALPRGTPAHSHRCMPTAPLPAHCAQLPPGLARCSSCSTAVIPFLEVKATWLKLARWLRASRSCMQHAARQQSGNAIHHSTGQARSALGAAFSQPAANHGSGQAPVAAMAFALQYCLACVLMEACAGEARGVMWHPPVAPGQCSGLRFRWLAATMAEPPLSPACHTACWRTAAALHVAAGMRS